MTPIIIAEDDPLVLGQLCEMLSDCYDILGTASNGAELVSAAAELGPELVVTDIKMPGTDGLRAARTILSEKPDLRVVFVSTSADPELVRAALDTGASGYVLKVAAGKDLIPAMQAALEGRTFVSKAALRL